MIIAACIFARGGSKGLPGKNIRDFAGKPLIAWAIEQALALKAVDEVIVSTDSAEIAEIARNYGASVPFVRPSELRLAEWKQIDFNKNTWGYFIAKTKVNHIVPLSTQALAILKELHQINGQGRYVFPSRDGPDKPMGENSMLTDMRRLGITKEDMSIHGFRAMARTILNEEMDVPVHLIEHQLSHKVKDANGTSYNRTKHLAKRQEMMQNWSDYLDNLKDGD